MVSHDCRRKWILHRAVLSIGQTGQMPEPRVFGGLALEYQNTPLLVFIFLGCLLRVKIVELFD